MPQLSPNQINDTTRFSERLKALGAADYGRARPQPKESALSAAFRALEREVYGQEQSYIPPAAN